MITVGMSVRDDKAASYLPLFFQRTRAEGVRSFIDAVNDPKHQFYAHSEDYILFEICKFDDQTGVVEFKQEAILRAADAKKVV